MKQKRAYKRLLLNKDKNLKETLLHSGYSMVTANQPQSVTQSLGFRSLIDRTLSDDLLAKKHVEGLNATKHTPATLYQDERDDIPDYSVRHKYLETGLKLKGYLKDDAGNTFNTLVITDEQTRRIAQELLHKEKPAE